MATFWTTQWL